MILCFKHQGDYCPFFFFFVSSILTICPIFVFSTRMLEICNFSQCIYSNVCILVDKIWDYLNFWWGRWVAFYFLQKAGLYEGNGGQILHLDYDNFLLLDNTCLFKGCLIISFLVYHKMRFAPKSCSEVLVVLKMMI